MANLSTSYFVYNLLCGQSIYDLDKFPISSNLKIYSYFVQTNIWHILDIVYLLNVLHSIWFWSYHKEETSNQSNPLRLGGFDRKMLGLDCWLAKVSDHLIAGDSFVTAAAEWLLVTIFTRRSACGQVYNLFALNIICKHNTAELCRVPPQYRPQQT